MPHRRRKGEELSVWKQAHNKSHKQVRMVTPADMADRDAAKEALFRLRLMHPEITIVWADSAYAGQLVADCDPLGPCPFDDGREELLDLVPGQAGPPVRPTAS